MRLPVAVAVLGSALALAAAGAQGAPAAPSACAPGYSPCLPVVDDLDCGEIPDSKKPIRVTGRDQYRLDADGDGVACESGASGSPPPPLSPPSPPAGAVVDHVSDGDTLVLRNGKRVRLVQIDTPEVFFGVECYGPAASARTKRLLPPGTKVRLLVEPATDRVDAYGRLLRYVVRVKGSMNVNIHLVAVGAAAPYFYQGVRGRYANRLEALAKAAREKKLGLWKACPGTVYDPYRAIETRG